ncbi:unnamed protein product [Lathyrus sativus]|nr:unnamed protein product [Lathyrus sativus]CAK8076243.1 unnamed protein product [Lathyrus sativus]
MEDFSDFIDNLDLVELSVVRSKFTRRRSDCDVSNRLSKILISSGLVKMWNCNGLVIGLRDVSDHCPVWLKYKVIDWGPKLFRFVKGWFEHGNFLDFVMKEWSSIKVEGKKTYIMKQKLKILKGRLK